MINYSSLKTLRRLLNLTLNIYDKDFTKLTDFQQNEVPLFYDHKHILEDLYESEKDFLFYYGIFGEIFLAYYINRNYIVIGPWRSNAIDESLLRKKAKNISINSTENSYLYKSLSNLPFFPLSQIRDILILVNFCLTGTVEDKLSESLNDHIKSWCKNFDEEKLKQFVELNYTSYNYQYQYENDILRAVRQGNNKALKEVINFLSMGIIPNLSKDSLRSEKNYSIAIFDRLAQEAIRTGLDISTAYQSRDQFIRNNELCETSIEILKLRDTAILFYTQQIGEIKKQSVSSPTIIAIIQFLKNNLNQKIKTSTIAKQFHMSESKLRKLFKQEQNMTIQQYFLNLKIDTAKSLLLEGISLSCIAETFAFSSPSNFSRAFKKVVGVSPTKFISSATMI